MILPWKRVRIDGGELISTSLTEPESVKLRELSTGKRVLEVGSAYGYSSILMATGGAKSVLAVDPHGVSAQRTPSVESSLKNMRAHVNRYRCTEQISILLAPSQVALPMLYQIGARFDLVFIDGDHSEPVVEHDVLWGRGLLVGDGVLAVHDYGEESCPGVKAALDRMRRSHADVVDTLYVEERRG